MTDAGDQIIKIIEKVESELKLPSGVLREIYDEELAQVHRDIRKNYVDIPLREVITKYFKKYNEN